MHHAFSKAQSHSDLEISLKLRSEKCADSRSFHPTLKPLAASWL